MVMFFAMFTVIMVKSVDGSCMMVVDVCFMLMVINGKSIPISPSHI